MKKPSLASRTTLLATAILAVTSVSLTAAEVIMVNFSNSAGNDMLPADGKALGVEVYQNVTTGSTSTGTTAAINLDSVTGGVSYADYYQSNQKANLLQPNATFVGAKQITNSGITAVAGTNSSVYVTLNLGPWMAAGGWTRYKVTVYYAGRSAAAETLMTDGTPDVTFFDGVNSTTDTMTVYKHGTGTNAALFAGIGAPHLFTSNTLTINMRYLGGTSTDYQAGIAAIKIEDGTNPNPQTLLWNGAKDGEWSTNVLGSPTNWLLASDGITPSDFKNKDSVTFDDSLTSFTTSIVNISAADVKPDTVNFLNNSTALTLTGSKGMRGTGNVSIAGAAGLRIENANAFFGTTSHSAGALILANPLALQNSILATDFPETVTFDGITAATLGGLAGTDDIVLENTSSAAVALTLGNNNNSASHTGELSGTGSIIKIGTGTQTFNFESNYSGGTTIAAGPAQADASGTAAAIHVAVSNALGTGPITCTNTVNTSLLRFTGGNVELPNAITLPSTGGLTNEITVNNAQTATLSGKISGGAANSILHIDSTASGASSLLKLTNANNDFTASTVRMWRGGLAITSDGALGNADNDIDLFTESVNGPLRFDADNITLNANRQINFYTNEAAAAFNTQAYTATVAGDFTGVGNLFKQGSGKLILTGTNNATGKTTVAEGTLQVNGIFATGGDIVTVNTIGTLSGSGTINRAVMANGKLSPGAGTIGTLAMGDVSFNSSAGYHWEINDWTGNAGTGYDTIIANSLAISANNATPITVVVAPSTLANFANSSATFTLMTTTTGITGFSADAFVVDASSLPAATGTWTLAKNGNNLDLVFTYSAFTPFQTWANANITSVNPLAPAGFADDADGDGIANGLEWALGGGPLTQDAATLVTTTATASGGLVLSFKRAESAIGQLALTVQWDTDLADGFANSIVVNTEIAPNGNNPSVAIDTATTPDTVTVTIPAANALGGKLFARLHALQP